MSEKIQNHDIRVESGGLTGIARIVRVGQEALKWQISILAENGNLICDMDGPDIHGEGSAVPSVGDRENAQRQINEAIDQFLWDPMSRA